jgi:hypothetical protein
VSGASLAAGGACQFGIAFVSISSIEEAIMTKFIPTYRAK